ncbi:MAG: hypothetical protein ACI9MR_002855 [Myxococcota bacterium]|jgi:hypothetical protein
MSPVARYCGDNGGSMTRFGLGWLVLALIAAGCGDDRSGAVGSERTVEACTDNADNDGDGFFDCGDQDCWGVGTCTGQTTGEADTSTGSDTTDTGVADSTDATTDNDTDAADTAAGTCEPCGTGSVKGRVCAPNRQVFVNDAAIAIDGIGCDGQPFHIESTSGVDGTWQLNDVPCGTHTIVMTKGSFTSTFDVAVATGRISDLTGAANKQCFGASSAPIAVLDGNYDDLEGLLDDLGLTYDLYNELGDNGARGKTIDLLASPSAMAQYSIIFANCGGFNGGIPQDHASVMGNVRSWVLAGGNLYMSDYAWVLGEWSFPDAIEFQGSDDPDDMYKDGSPQLIPTDTVAQATVVDGALAGYLGSNTLQVTFDQGPQIAPESTGVGTFAHVVGTFPVAPFNDELTGVNIPLVMSYRPGDTAGRVIYTNFHNDAQTSADMLVILNYLVFTL